MGTLSGAEVLDSYEYLRGDVARFGLASLFAECVVLSGEADSHSKKVYNCLGHFLATLESAANPVAHTAQYLLILLELLGFRPELEICTVCGRKAESFPGVRSSRGGVVCPRCVSREPVTFPLDKGLLKALRASQRMDYTRLSTLKMSAAQANQALRLMVQLLREHLESELKSYKFLESMVLRNSKSATTRKTEK
ncbi:MAG: DNA repair protein RecO [bacterium]